MASDRQTSSVPSIRIARLLGQDGELRRLGRLECLGRRVLGKLAFRWCQTRAHSKLGLARLGDYTKSHFGMSRSAFSELAKIEKKLAALPSISQAFESGRLTWSKLEILMAMATPETEAALAAVAERATVRQLEEALRRIKHRCVDAGSDACVGADAVACVDAGTGGSMEARAPGGVDADREACVDNGVAGSVTATADCVDAGAGGCLGTGSGLRVASAGGCVDAKAACSVGVAGLVDAVKIGCVDATGAREELWESFSRRVRPRVRGKFEQAIEHCRKTAGEQLARWRAIDWIAADFLSGLHRMQGSEWSERLESYNWKQGLHPIEGRLGHSAFLDAAETPNIASPLPQGEGPGVRDGISTNEESFYNFARRDLEETSEHWKHLDWSIAQVELPPDVAALAQDVDEATPHQLHERIVRIIQYLQKIESETAPLMKRFHAGGGTGALSFFDHRHYLEQRAGLPARAFWRFAQHNRWARLSPALEGAFAQGTIHREHAKEIERVVGDLPEQPWIERAQQTHLPRFEQELTEALCGRLEALDRSTEISPIWFRAPESVIWHWMAAVTEARYLAPLGTCPVELILDAFLQQPTEKIRREHRVFERDGWRCQAPGCFSRRNLQAHHIQFRSHGGSDDQENLVTICWSCHLHGIHERRLKVTGKAPDGLTWEVGCRSDGPPLRVYGLQEEAQPEWGQRYTIPTGSILRACTT